MKTHSVILFSLLLAACGGSTTSDSEKTSKPDAPKTETPQTSTDPNNSSTSINTGIKLEKFSIQAYADLAKRTSVNSDSLEGTWAAVWSTEKKRTNIKVEPVVAGTPNLKSDTLELVIIKKTKGDNNYRVASCHGDGFEAATLTDNKLVTKNRTLSVEGSDNKNMIGSYYDKQDIVLKPRPGTPAIGLSATRSFTNEIISSGRYIKISNSIESLGKMKQHWDDDTDPSNDNFQKTTKEIYCASIETFVENGANLVRIGSDDKMEFIVTPSDLDPSVPLAKINEPTFNTVKSSHTGLMDTGETLCKAALNIHEVKEVNKNIEFQFDVIISELLADPEDENATIGERVMQAEIDIDLSGR